MTNRIDSTNCTHEAALARIQELEGKLDAALKELDEASPMRACDRCGKEDRQHRMMIEEGDEWECVPCWERCNAKELAELEKDIPQ